MSKPIIVKVVFCEGTVFGDLFCAYYASGRIREIHGNEPIPKAVMDFCESHKRKIDKINQHKKRYVLWE